MSNPDFSGTNLDAVIGERAYLIMWRAKLTQSKLAPRIGVDQPGLGRRLRGETRWTSEELAALARELDTSVAYLFGEVDDQEWAPSGSNRRPRDYSVDGSVTEGHVTPMSLAPVTPITEARSARHELELAQDELLLEGVRGRVR